MFKLIFFKGKGTFVDTCIKFFTRSEYSHCEILIDGYQYSCSPKSGIRKEKHIFNNKVWDYFDIDLLFKKNTITTIQPINPKDLDLLGQSDQTQYNQEYSCLTNEIIFSEKRDYDKNLAKQILLNFFENEKDSDYDLISILLSNIFPFGIQNNNKWTCSEFCYTSLLLIGCYELAGFSASKINPGKLYKLIKYLEKY